MSADQGNALARLGLSGLYYAGKGTRVDAAQGFALARQAAAQGNATAMYIVADAYRNGLGVSKDAAAALVAMNKAAEAGSLDAQMDLAEILEKGEGTNINIEGAISWYKKKPPPSTTMRPARHWCGWACLAPDNADATLQAPGKARRMSATSASTCSGVVAHEQTKRAPPAPIKL